MIEHNALDPNETPEDVATLYSWANLHGAKYRDFSASRAQTREKARERVQQAIDDDRRNAFEEAEARKVGEVKPMPQETYDASKTERLLEIHRREDERRPQQEAKVVEVPVRQPLSSAARAPYVSAGTTFGASYGAPNQPAAPVSNYSAPGQAPGLAPGLASAHPSGHAPGQANFAPPSGYSEHPLPQASAPVNPAAVNPAALVPARDEAPNRGNSWVPAESRERGASPAWLSADRNDVAPAPVQQAPADTLQGSRDRLTSRWFALKGVFAGSPVQSEAAPAPAPSRAPVLAVFSLAGGVGKTSLVATLGRALSARGERVLLVDTAAFGLLPFFFGARDQRPGVLRTFTPPGQSGDSPIQMLTMDPEALGPENAPQEILTQEIMRNGHGANRVIVDLATASGSTTRRILRMSPTALVPVIPDMSSVVSVSSIDTFFQRHSIASGQPVLPFYVLNQFDSSLPLHLDVREVLREQLGDRLLPFSLRRTPAVAEALAEGMTVVDYAPNSTVAEDFGALAGWVKSLAAPATTGFRGVRWSER